MLQILCLVHRDRKQLPERRVELYRECVSVLLELWRAAKDMPITFDAQQALRLLQPLAYALHTANEREAELEELLPHLDTPLRELRRDPEDGARLLEAIRDQSGVLVFLGQSKYGFLHLSFQEYLTALHIQDRHGGGDSRVLRDLAEHFGDGWWREVILLCLGLNNPSLFGPLMDALIEAGVLHRDVALADDCLRDALASSPRPLLRALVAGIGDDSERYHVLRLLRAFEDWREVELDGAEPVAVIEGLARDDESPQVKGMALELLGGKLEERPLSKAVSPIESFSIESERPGERIHERDGSVLVYVPQGVYTLGTDEILEGYAEKNRHWPQPEHRVHLSRYWIGKYPVTNAQYGKFLEATGHREPEEWQNRQFNEPEQPVVGVDWSDADAYCRWAGLELPSEAQWEAAARGMDRRTYPWGNEAPTKDLANFDFDRGATSPVGAYPEGAGPFGTLDQAGNVWEWCRDAFDDKAYVDRDGEEDPVVEDDDKSAARVVRGGAWDDRAGSLPSAIRYGGRPGSRFSYLGFRVVCRSGPEP